MRRAQTGSRKVGLVAVLGMSLMGMGMLSTAQAGGLRISVGFDLPVPVVVSPPQPVIVQRPPVIVQRPPVIVQRPVIVSQPPVVVQPYPVVVEEPCQEYPYHPSGQYSRSHGQGPQGFHTVKVRDERWHHGRHRGWFRHHHRGE